jgi:cytochrome c oxidase subunit 2
MSSFSMTALPSASISADNFESFINVATLVGALMFIGTMAAVFYFAIRYRRKNDRDEGAYIPGTYLVEFVGIFGISIWVAVFFIWGWRDYSYMITPRADEFEVNVIGQQWQWQIQYADGKSYSNEVYLPVNRPVRFVMTSKDVLHSFFIPEFRHTQDVVPGQFTTLHVTPTLVGDFHIFCAEYCGTAHSKMLGVVHVLSKEDFQKWQDGLYVSPVKTVQAEVMPELNSRMTMAEKGAHVFKAKACVSGRLEA